MNLKEKVRACRKLCGTHVSLNDAVVAEVLGYAGFDFLWIDLEHSSLDCESVLRHLGGARAAGTPAIVRVPEKDRTYVKRVLEMGPDGIVFPMVNTREEADAAMRSCLYPPRGNRGFGPRRAVKYGMRDLDEYIRQADSELCRFIQIESETAVRNLPDIVGNSDIDGCIFGPCDLSGSIGELNNVFGKRNIALIREAVAVLKEAGKCIGISTGSADPAVIEFWNDLGINMISSGVDYDYLLRGAQRNREHIRRIQECGQNKENCHEIPRTATI